jgi:DMSO/TMAO reductase YedYZ molybdopterin-dependent catalytic subunit
LTSVNAVYRTLRFADSAEINMLFEGQDRRQLERQMKQAGRLPPGQSLTLKWPVLHYGSVPNFNPAAWDLQVYGEVENPLKFSWKEFNALPKVEITSDFHCVTRWSRFDNRWNGVAKRELLRQAKPRPEAAYVLVHAEQGYTANVPLADLDRDNVLLATHHDGEPLSGEHGFPLRLIVPHLYAWKSVKWVRGLELMNHDQAGFWEQNGYHMYGDPFKEQRYSSR